MNKYSDIHIHPTIKPYNHVWNSLRKSAKDFSYNFRRSSFEKLKKSNVKLAVVSLYPVEQGWFIHLPGDGKNYKTSSSAKKLLGSSWPNTSLWKRIKHIKSAQYDYFGELLGEYDFLLKTIERYKSHFFIPENKNQLINRTQQGHTAIIPSIEGAHALISGNYYDIFENKTDFDKIHRNIDHLKNNQLIFFITFSHHFFNGLAGHAHSFYKLRLFLNQIYGKGDPLSQQAWEIIKHLLAVEEYKNQGYRILIDTKHFSKAARLEFFEYIKTYNNGKEQNEKIPIVASHCAYAGVKNIFEVGNYTDNFAANETNLSDYEIKEIYRSGGIIGINFDQDVLGYKTKPRPSTELLADNILAMAEVLANEFNTPEIWKVFAIGSDFDGYIDPVDKYDDVTKYALLEHDLEEYFANSILFDKLSYGMSPAEVTSMIMSDNAFDFAVKHFPRKGAET